MSNVEEAIVYLQSTSQVLPQSHLVLNVFSIAKHDSRTTSLCNQNVIESVNKQTNKQT